MRGILTADPFEPRFEKCLLQVWSVDQPFRKASWSTEPAIVDAEPLFLEGSRVLEVAPGRDETSADTLWNTFSWEQKEQVQAVAMDMWQAYQNSVDVHVPDAGVVHDRFHISKHLNEAMD